MTPYGQVFVRPGSTVDYHLRFPGHIHDPDLDLHYSRFRDYDPKLGRYLQADPMGIRGGVNLYAYPPNPLVTVDVLGLNDHSNSENGSTRPEDGESTPRAEDPNAPPDAPPPDGAARPRDATEIARDASRARAQELHGTLSRRERREAVMVAGMHDPETGQTVTRTNVEGAAFNPDGPDTHPIVQRRVAEQRDRVALARETAGDGGTRAMSDAELGAALERRGIPNTPESREQARQASDRAAYREEQLGRPLNDDDWAGMEREVGHHGEVVALNDTLQARDAERARNGRPPTTDEEMGNIGLHNQQLPPGKNREMSDNAMPRCDHCQSITNGVDPHGDVVAGERRNAARDAARRDEGDS
ncbi:MAG: RHS repeat-associated core domain-containing protein [Nannocystaceae bacterium]|nr:RHS repeat-associated core domain-containing protein [Nannocystaceae bacterium]